MKMSSSNRTLIESAEFVLLCFPGDWSWRKGLLSSLLLLMLMAATAANMILIRVIQREQSLHNPMYYLICILSFVDLTVCWLVATPVLNSLWFSSKTITPSSCFAQTYFISTLVTIESGIFMLMSFDRYHAICNPLKYPLIVTNNNLLKAVVAALGRSTISSAPRVILIAQLNYCNETVINQCFCETLTVSSLACDPNPVIGIYCFILSSLTTGFDLTLITFSYFMILRAVLKLRSQEAFAKAIGTCSSHLILIVFFYSSIIVLVIAGVLADRISSDIYSMLSVLFCLIPPVLNPLIYGLRTKVIREKIIWTIKKVIVNRKSAKVGS